MRATPVLLDDERTETKVKCRICGDWITWAKSRLFLTKEGTIRTCQQGNLPHVGKGKR